MQTASFFNSPSELVYHYTSCKVLKSILNTGVIIFGRLQHTNDPYEKDVMDLGPGGFNCTEDQIIAVDKRLSKLNERARLFCTTFGARGYAIPPLWAHYAKKHQGVCLVFDKARLCRSFEEQAGEVCQYFFADNVNYDGIPNLSSPVWNLDLNHSTADCHFETYYKQTLFMKDPSWNYENEYRFLAVTKNNRQFKLAIDSLVGIVRGEYFPDKYIELISDARDKYKVDAVWLDWQHGHPQPYLMNS